MKVILITLIIILILHLKKKVSGDDIITIITMNDEALVDPSVDLSVGGHSEDLVSMAPVQGKRSCMFIISSN